MTEEDIAVEAALAAARVLEAHDGSGLRHKGAVDLVTEADLQAEAAVRQVLAQHTPTIEVLGEEGGGAEDARTRWVVDPLDGTTNFVHGVPHYAVSIALEIDGELTVGVVHDVARQRTYRATRGQGGRVGDQPLAVSTTADLQHALVATGFPYDRRERADLYLQLVRMALMHTQAVRRFGSAALDLAFVAEGRFDAYFEFNLARWDMAAGLVLVQEAGGRVDAIPGEELGMRGSPVASNGWVHEALIALISSTIS